MFRIFIGIQVTILFKNGFVSFRATFDPLDTHFSNFLFCFTQIGVDIYIYLMWISVCLVFKAHFQSSSKVNLIIVFQIRSRLEKKNERILINNLMTLNIMKISNNDKLLESKDNIYICRSSRV